MMQGDYYGFNQGPPQVQAFSHVGFFPPFGYSIGSSVPSNRNLERLKKSKLRHLESRKHEDVTNSTDESIHLVSSRKTGESAPNRYDGEHMKKRSQSGNSIGKNSDLNDIDLNPQRNRSQSEEGSISPNNTEETQSRNASANRNSNETSSSKGKSKKKRERRIKKSPLNYDIENHLIDNMYLPNNQQFIVQQAGYGIEIQRPPVHYPGQEVWPGEYGGVAPSQVHQTQPQQQYVLPEQQYYQGGAWPGQAYDIAPGGPVSAVEYTYGQIPQQNVPYDPNVAYNQAYYPLDPGYQGIPIEQSLPSQSYGPVPESSQPVGFIPGLPPGAKIVAEYFLGYLDEQQANQSHPSHHSQQQLQQLQTLQPINPYQQTYQYPCNTQPSIVNQLHSQQPLQPYQPCPPSHSSKEDVEIEVWEKSKKKKQDDDYDDNKICKAKVDDDDLKKLKEDIINTIQKELGNLKINGPSHIHHHTAPAGGSSGDSKQEPIQPIFLMPKPSEQPAPKPIYIPRNIYVPVIRPVFVPRERIIVRPQIIHVARPVLVDRPVPVQQRPIVIERDRPVPVRVETVERTETVGGGGEVTRNIETGQEVTYHEFSQNYPVGSGNNSSSADYANQQFSYQQNQYNEQVDYEENRRKQEVLSILEEAERRKQALQSKSNDDVGQYKYSKYENASENNKTLDSLIGNTQGYTLEVLDQRVSDKFERTDQETIKARYGVDSFQYLPSGELNTQQNRTISNNYGQIANNNEYYTNSASQGVANNEYYSNTTAQNLGTSGSFKSLASATEARRSTSNMYNANYGGDSTTPYGTITNVTQIPSPGSRGVNQSQAPVVIQNVQKMIQNFGPGYPDQPNSSSIIIEN